MWSLYESVLFWFCHDAFSPCALVIFAYLLTAPEKWTLKYSLRSSWRSPLPKMPCVALAGAQVVFTWVIRVGRRPQGVGRFSFPFLFYYSAQVHSHFLYSPLGWRDGFSWGCGPLGTQLNFRKFSYKILSIVGGPGPDLCLSHSLWLVNRV